VLDVLHISVHQETSIIIIVAVEKLSHLQFVGTSILS